MKLHNSPYTYKVHYSIANFITTKVCYKFSDKHLSLVKGSMCSFLRVTAKIAKPKCCNFLVLVKKKMACHKQLSWLATNVQLLFLKSTLIITEGLDGIFLFVSMTSVLKGQCLIIISHLSCLRSWLHSYCGNTTVKTDAYLTGATA